MVHEHLKGLRLDRRALRRRNWISSDELRKEMDALPDVAAKGMEAGAAPDPAAGGESPAEFAKFAVRGSTSTDTAPAAPRVLSPDDRVIPAI